MLIIGPNETLSDIIDRAGGLRLNAYGAGSKFTRRSQSVKIDIDKILKRSHSEADIQVQDGDELYIASKANMIEIRGQVNTPGYYKYKKGRRIRDIIRGAGGFTLEAEKNDIYISYPNGQSKKYNRWIGNSRVLDGSIITVGKKEPEEPFDKTGTVKKFSFLFKKK